jgi:hypothetical protein
LKVLSRIVQAQLHLSQQGVRVAAVVGGDHGVVFVDTFSSASSLPSQGEGRGGVGWSFTQEKSGLSRNREIKTPPLRPSQLHGVNGGGFAVLARVGLFSRRRCEKRAACHSEAASRQATGVLPAAVPGHVGAGCGSQRIGFSVRDRAARRQRFSAGPGRAQPGLDLSLGHFGT